MSDTNLQNIFDNFDYVLNDYDNLESIAFAKNLTSKSIIENIRSDNKNKNNDIFLLKNINDIDTNTKVNVNTSIISIFDLELITLGSIDGNEYFVINAINANESLLEYPILDINNGSI
ncbi:7746_t:CDS:2 [Funneliformis mosseae]|uniref:7746_t:CDS:1 n=1 Tax=Funneliformis mosseae TaxID=27381 RepID=A0A9N8WHL3_FUNMO|nr:7746_t:CDS:2 [Funneliformis mosseae]